MNLLLSAELTVKQALLDSLGVPACLVVKLEEYFLVEAMNDRFREFYGLSPQSKQLPITTQTVADAIGIAHVEAVSFVNGIVENYVNCFDTAEPVYAESRIPRAEGALRWSRNTISPVELEGEIVSLLVSSIDITELIVKQREIEKNLTRLISQHVRVCRSCTKIENEEGQWQILEDFMLARSDLEFSHGICPSCKADFK